MFFFLASYLGQEPSVLDADTRRRDEYCSTLPCVWRYHLLSERRPLSRHCVAPCQFQIVAASWNTVPTPCSKFSGRVVPLSSGQWATVRHIGAQATRNSGSRYRYSSVFWCRALRLGKPNAAPSSSQRLRNWKPALKACTHLETLAKAWATRKPNSTWNNSSESEACRWSSAATTDGNPCVISESTRAGQGENRMVLGIPFGAELLLAAEHCDPNYHRYCRGN